jgi:hypothetical protein
LTDGLISQLANRGFHMETLQEIANYFKLVLLSPIHLTI